MYITTVIATNTTIPNIAGYATQRTPSANNPQRRATIAIVIPIHFNISINFSIYKVN